MLSNHNCMRCGAANRPVARYCGQCGQPIRVATGVAPIAAALPKLPPKRNGPGVLIIMFAMVAGGFMLLAALFGGTHVNVPASINQRYIPDQYAPSITTNQPELPEQAPALPRTYTYPQHTYAYPTQVPQYDSKPRGQTVNRPQW